MRKRPLPAISLDQVGQRCKIGPMKRVGFFLVGFVVGLLLSFGIGGTLQFLGFIWVSEIIAKTSLLVAIGVGVTAVKVFAPKIGDGHRPTKEHQAEIEAFRRAEEWRKG